MGAWHGSRGSSVTDRAWGKVQKRPWDGRAWVWLPYYVDHKDCMLAEVLTKGRVEASKIMDTWNMVFSDHPLILLWTRTGKRV